jgi:energy-coupling factor transport system substrate-specific component
MQAASEKRSLWTFGTREVVYSAIGAALYAVLNIATNFLALPGAGNVSFRPGVAIPMFFGVAFGPVVGFIAGFLGNMLGDLASGGGFWPWWDLGSGLMGLIPGLIALAVVNYRDPKSIGKALVMVVLGIVVGMGVASISELWVSGADINAVIFQNFTPAAVTNLVNGIVLVPILMVAYGAVVARSGR